MAFQWDVGDLVAVHRINHHQSAAAVPDDETMGYGIDANIVGVVAEIDPPEIRIIFSLEQSQRTIAGICDI